MNNRRNLARQRQQLLEALGRLCGSSGVKNPLPLVDKLYEMDMRVVEDYLLQVAHVCITHPQADTQAALHQYMLWIAGRSLQVALRLSWIVDAVSPFYLTTGLSNRVKEVHDNIESYAINQVLHKPVPLSHTNRARRSTLHDTTEMVEEKVDLRDVRRKELRLRIFTDQRAFVARLTEISEDLRKYPDRSKRKQVLRNKLRQLNQCLGDQWVMHPLGRSTDPVRWIVGIAIEECVVFSSRERAPYLIRYEVLTDPTATMQDPSLTTLRADNGDFRREPDGEEYYVPCVSPGTSSPEPDKTFIPEDVRLRRIAFGEGSESLRARCRRMSPWGAHPNWEMKAMIIKAGDDIRQEELALQIIHAVQDIWREQGLTCRATPYMACATHSDRGLLEFIEDANSIDGIKKSTRMMQLNKFFEVAFGGAGTATFLHAQQSFVESMAGYSVIGYLLQIKDRHNGNLMINCRGELVHIDFGFFLTTSPGGWNFESAPFKLSQELIDVMGGINSDAYNYYKTLVFMGFETIREYAADVISLTSLMSAYNSMPCFGSDPGTAVMQFQSRFSEELSSEVDFAMLVKNLITASADNWRTRRYDQFQTIQNGIL